MIRDHAPTITHILHLFLETKFLFWLEILSILGAAWNAVEALQITTDSLEVCRVSKFDALAKVTQTVFRSHQRSTWPTTVSVS